MNKENSKRAADKSKDSRNNFKKPVTTSKGEDLNTGKQNERSMRSRNSVVVNNNLKNPKENLRKTVSPNLTGLNHNLSKTSKNLLDNNTNIILNIKPVDVKGKIEVKDADNTDVNSKNKRKYSELVKETVNEVQDFKTLQEHIEYLYSLFSSNDRSWQENFTFIIAPFFSLVKDSFHPNSLSIAASKIFSTQKFWILWIEHIKQEISLEKLICLFNESFNHVNEESLIKAYYLKTIRESDPIALNDYMKSIGRVLDLNILTKSLPVTNQVLFSLLASYAQFLVRSSSKNQFSSSEKKMKKLLPSSGMKFESNIELTINPINSKKDFNNNNQIYSNENVSYIFSGKLENEEIIKIQREEENKNNISFLTPSRESKRESLVNNDPLINHSISCHNSLFKESETRDIVDALKPLSPKIETMIVSQATIQKQSEFIVNLQNANLIKLNLLSQGEHKDEQLTQIIEAVQSDHTDPIQKVVQIEKLENKIINNLEINVTNCSNIVNITENTHYVDKLDYNINPDDDSALNYIDEISRYSMLTISSSPKKVEDSDAEDVESKIQEEILDVIEELEGNVCEGDKIPFSGNNENVFSCNSITKDRLNNSQYSKSRSQSRSKSIPKRNQSYVSEEYPSDIVEGTIKKFNKSFIGCDSAKSKSDLSSKKKKIN